MIDPVALRSERRGLTNYAVRGFSVRDEGFSVLQAVLKERFKASAGVRRLMFAF